MADKADKNEPYRMSGEQLVQRVAKEQALKSCLSMDLGIGGGISGGTIVIGGKSGLGKTTLALNYAAYGQNHYKKKVFFYPIEGRLSAKIFCQVPDIKLGDGQFEIVLPPPLKNKAGEIVGHQKWHSQQWWTTIGQCIIDNPNSIHIVDSIANMSSEKEISEGIGYQGRGEDKKWESQFCRTYGDLIVSSGTTLFLITHIQANTSGYGAPIQLKLGNHFKHQADLILFGKTVEKWPEENGRILGHDMVYLVEKNSFGAPFSEIKVPLKYGAGIAYSRDLMIHGINWGFIKAKGAWYCLPLCTDPKGKLEFKPPPDDLDEQKAGNFIRLQGEATVRKFLEENKEAYDLIDNKVREILL